MKTLPTVRDIMQHPPVLLKADMRICEAIAKLLKHKLSGAPVVDEQGHVVGMLSEKDCLSLFTNAAFNQMPEANVSGYMSRELVTISPSEGIFVAADQFLKNSFRRMPVLEDGKLVGLVSRHDVLEGTRKIWECGDREKPWTDSKYLTDQIKAALK